MTKKDYGMVSMIVLLSIIVDQITKIIIVNTMSIGESIPLINGFFSITSHRNQGAAWGMLQGEMTLFYAITVLATLIFIYFLRDGSFKTKKVYTLGVSLMIGGMIGNFIDRLMIKEVIDFLDFDIFGYDFPIFNVADSCLVVGAILFGFIIVKETYEEYYAKNSSNS